MPQGGESVQVSGLPVAQSSRRDEIIPLLQGYEGLTLGELDDLKAGLMTRVESKYLMTYSQCLALVRKLSGKYRILDINGIRLCRYDTIYYDNAAFLTYLAHHNGKGNRFKLRVRSYDSTKQTYLEVKKKTNRGTSEKMRVLIRPHGREFRPSEAEFLRSTFPYDYCAFHPVIRTCYDRFTLVSRDMPERITFDTGITFQDGRRSLTFPAVVIGEVKHEKGQYHSEARESLRAMGIRKQGFSKYCTGIAFLYDQVKHNRFKENLLYLGKLATGGTVPC